MRFKYLLRKLFFHRRFKYLALKCNFPLEFQIPCSEMDVLPLGVVVLRHSFIKDLSSCLFDRRSSHGGSFALVHGPKVDVLP